MQQLLREKRKLKLPEIISKQEKQLLKQGVPIQKIIGFINFDNLEIKVNNNVFIPRYETFEVVQKALEYINYNSHVLDLCTGSGYIGLTIKQKTNASVVMSDISKDAIKQAKLNAKLNKLNVKIVQSNMFENIQKKFDVIVSNPPYVPWKTRLPTTIQNYEPLNALYGGKSGNDFYKIICENATKYLKPNGIIILEISEDNKKYLESQKFQITKDINNKPRIAVKKFK